MKNDKRFIRFITFCLFLFVYPCSLPAQSNSGYDSSYYKIYPRALTARFYFSKKYSAFTLPAFGNEDDLQYRPNTDLTTGVGATYQNISLNLSYGFGFLNHDDAKGKTKSVDLELHVYPTKWAVDLLAIFHKGLHLHPEKNTTANNYYYRPDVNQHIIGAGAYRVLNAEKFSYNAAMIQSEWQKKSAGSLLVGGQVYYGLIKGDSSLVPKQLENSFAQPGINRINFFSAGPGIGYAYTLVIQKHFYITGSLIANLDVDFSSEETINKKNNKVAVNPGAVYKAAIGYNSDSWNISANWAGNSLWINGASSAGNYFVPTGNYRFVLAKKISRNKH
jgi:hypothetical protein